MKDISIDKRVITIKELLHRIDFSKIIISKHDRMDVKSQRELIESILLGLPLNNFLTFIENHIFHVTPISIHIFSSQVNLPGFLLISTFKYGKSYLGIKLY